MLPSQSRWQLAEVCEDTVERLRSSCNLHPIVARLLAIRGIQTPEAAREFLTAGKEALHDPFLLAGMEEAVTRICTAVENKEKIRIYGDYDADGVSSTALLVRLFQKLNVDHDYYVPHRVKEGYGLNKPALEQAKNEGVQLIITVDNGIGAVEEVAFASELGIDCIITDHHEPPDQLPLQARAIINPKINSCSYPFKQLAGAGVALKLAQALWSRLELKEDEFPNVFFELAALGTIADLVPLIGENRIIAKIGLERLNNSRLVGIRTLIEMSGMDSERLTESHVGFMLGPRLNAGGRMMHADPAVKLLVTNHEQEARDLAHQLEELNRRRQALVEQISKEAIAMLSDQVLEDDWVIVIAQKGWNVGVVGIVASRIVEMKHRPVVVLSIDEETSLATGSARSIDGFDMYEALAECADLLEHFGGHAAAGGMTLKAEHIELFRQRLNERARRLLSEQDLVPILPIDSECRLEDVTLELIELTNQLAPFGMGNAVPKFYFRDVSIQQFRRIGKQRNHLKMMVQTKQRTVSIVMEAIAFGKGEVSDWISPLATVDLVGEIGVNDWNGMRKPQIYIEDLKVPKLQLYDWRGANNVEERMQQWYSAREAVGLKHTKALLITDPSSELDGQIDDIHVIHWQDVVKLPPLKWDEITDLFLSGMPNRLNELEFILRKTPALERVYALFQPNSVQKVPARERFKQVYAWLKKVQQIDLNDEQSLWRIHRLCGTDQDSLRFILDVFAELSFVNRENHTYRLVASPQRKPLDSSPLYIKRLSQLELEQRLIYSTGEQLYAWVTRIVEQKYDDGERNLHHLERMEPIDERQVRF